MDYLRVILRGFWYEPNVVNVASVLPLKWAMSTYNVADGMKYLCYDVQHKCPEVKMCSKSCQQLFAEAAGH